MQTVRYERTQDIPLEHEADVIVLGGGPGGIGAAVMAARDGARTLLIERYGCLGGMASIGEIHPFMPNHVSDEECLDGPVYLEWRQRMYQYYPPRNPLPENPHANKDAALRHISKEAAMLAAEDLCIEAGVQLLFHHQLADVIRDGERIDSIVLLSKSGFTAARAKVYIDASGDADLAAFAGCEYEQGGPTGHSQPMTMCFKLSHVDRSRMPDRREISRLYEVARTAGEIDCPREDVLMFDWLEPDVMHFNTTRVIHKSATSGRELSEAELIARRQVRQYLAFFRNRVPGFENCRIHSVAAQIGIRESRRVKGLNYITRDDYVNCSKFPDAISRVRYFLDIHNPDGSGTERLHLPDGEWYEIPFGCIVARDVKNLLIAGRPISVDHGVHSSMRVMPPACTVGQAAGVAAAVAARDDADAHKLDGTQIRNRLKELGAKL